MLMKWASCTTLPTAAWPISSRRQFVPFTRIGRPARTPQDETANELVLRPLDGGQVWETITVNALISPSDKTGIDQLASGLKRLGYKLIATDGTKAYLQSIGIDATSVSELTGFPEMLGGRVKTLHPMVHAGLLARTSDSGDLAEEARLVRGKNGRVREVLFGGMMHLPERRHASELKRRYGSGAG